jgi:hypothetical protein
VGAIRTTAIRFVWRSTDVDALLASIEQALGGEVGEWREDDELTSLTGFKTEEGINLASYWKPGFFSSLEPLGLSIDQDQLADGTDVLHVVAVIPPAGSPLGKGKQGLTKIATMSGATWLPFENMGTARLQVEFVNPR